MYSIRERKNGQGEKSYQILVKIIGYNGESVQKAMTWKPSYKMTDKQLQLALNRVATEFEQKVETEYAGKEKPIATDETYFNDFAQYWLSKIEKTRTASYYAGASNAFSKIENIMQEYRLKDLVPTVLEDIL